jgi:pyruvate, orthophosphate dikinase
MTTGGAVRTRYIYDFDEAAPGGRAQVGGKGLGLSEMTRMGLPVPAGFTVTTDACRDYLATGAIPGGLAAEIDDAVSRLELRTGRRFGAADAPLLVSVRSGAAISMPGMMDSVLDLGLSDAAADGLARTAGAHFAYDSYRRLIQMYGEVVDGIDARRFEGALSALEAERGVASEAGLSADDLAELVRRFKEIYRDELGHDFPQDARGQLLGAVEAVLRSWRNPRAEMYRRLNGIPDSAGTAANVVEMVFGNAGPNSATGVAFTRDPATGRRVPYGEFLVDAQGEDVVAGIRHPRPLHELATLMPRVYAELCGLLEMLELHYRDVQDVEFTIQDGRLFVLQTRSAKRTAAAAVKTAVDMANEELISREEAVQRIEPPVLEQLLHPHVDPTAPVAVAATGVPASPGAAVGSVVFDPDLAAERGAVGEPVILVRFDTTPDDIHGLAAARGILTAHGGLTSHAAVVARGMGKPCVAGCSELRIDEEARACTIGRERVAEGDVITVDGSTGRVVLGAAPLVEPGTNPSLETILSWADGLRTLGVRANADTPEDAARARAFGAEGIGLCRTEHMFFGDERLPVVQEMILADDEPSRRAALDRLLPFQQADFEAMFEAMAGLPVTVRLLDPPLHEFLPAESDAPDERVRKRIRDLRETNPMLGTRGCRLGLVWPEIYEMQIRAIARAARAVEARSGRPPCVEIMHPLVGFAEELRRLRALTERVLVEELPGRHVAIGTMIELPRAALRAGDIAEHADFFSFGTNDLTQTALGLSRDDAEGKFLGTYLDEGILGSDPFETLDREGVGELVELGVTRGRARKPDLKVGICGEHGGDPDSIAFCHTAGLDYVSCSPFRLPLARLAAARAALEERGTTYEVAGG